MAHLNNLDECEKQRLFDDASIPEPAPRTHLTVRERLFRHVLPCFLLLLALNVLFRSDFVCNHNSSQHKDIQPLDEETWVMVNGNTTTVALEAHIMSKCPDAKDCLQQLVLPAMAQISDKVDFKLSYIGSMDPDSDDVHCMHGPSECLGNIIQLCAADVYPEPIIYLGFANCMTSQYSKIPERELIESCALEHGIDFQKVNNCISEEGKGMDLLRKSVKHSHDNGVSTSCTVRLEGKVRCVRDGGKWYNCPGGSSVEDLVSEISELYQKKNAE